MDFVQEPHRGEATQFGIELEEFLKCIPEGPRNTIGTWDFDISNSGTVLTKRMFMNERNERHRVGNRSSAVDVLSHNASLLPIVLGWQRKSPYHTGLPDRSS